jgi:hypothetical protein
MATLAMGPHDTGEVNMTDPLGVYSPQILKCLESFNPWRW